MKNANTANNITTSTVTALTAQIIQGVKNIRNTQEWADMLKFQTGFWNYSFNNQLLIWAQSLGKATQVAGYKAWEKKGVHVRKGQKGMKILAPIIKKIEEDGKEESRVVGYRTVTVFDISQTDCEEAPSVWNLTEKSDEKALTLSYQIKALPFVGVCDEKAREEGNYRPSTGDIEIKFSHKANAFCGVFLHEYCHKMIHEDLKDSEGLKGIDRALEEIIVESCSYILCSLAGIDTETASFAYVACWLENGDKEDSEIEKALGQIEKVTNAAVRSLKNQGIELLPEAE